MSMGTLTAERDKLEIATMRAAVHGIAKGRIAVVEHPVNSENLSILLMKNGGMRTDD